MIFFEMRALPTFSMSFMISSKSPGPDPKPQNPMASLKTMKFVHNIGLEFMGHMLMFSMILVNCRKSH